MSYSRSIPGMGSNGIARRPIGAQQHQIPDAPTGGQIRLHRAADFSHDRRFRDADSGPKSHKARTPASNFFSPRHLCPCAHAGHDTATTLSRADA
jgi:hypothetical protein